jgi:hypothetical protein
MRPESSFGGTRTSPESPHRAGTRPSKRDRKGGGARMNTLRRLREAGQSVWIDFLRRGLITGGGLQRLIDEDGLAGVTSNPKCVTRADSVGTPVAGFGRPVRLSPLSHPKARMRACPRGNVSHLPGSIGALSSPGRASSRSYRLPEGPRRVTQQSPGVHSRAAATVSLPRPRSSPSMKA